MHCPSPNRNPIRRSLLVLALTTGALAAQAQESNAPVPATLKNVFELAWPHQPDAKTLALRRDAAQAQQRAASTWSPEPAALEMNGRSDRFQRNEGSRELEVGLAVPLWLPGERRGSGDLAQAEAAAVESRQQAAMLRFAASVRELWWTWQRARIDRDIAQDQLESARRLAVDTARRVSAGDLALADQHQADGAVAAAEGRSVEAAALAGKAWRQVLALTGDAALGEQAPPGLAEPLPVAGDARVHAALVELQDQVAVAQRAATLAATQKRANPELVLATTRDRGAFGERYARTVTLGMRIPFGAGPRHDARVAKAQVEALDAQVRLDLEQVQLKAGQDAALAKIDASRAQLVAAQRRATLARDTRALFDKSFRLGETDLPTRLRIETEAAQAEREAARGQVELAAAISDWRQSLGLLPQ